VHEDLLSQHSPFFASAAKEDWKEGQEHRVPLPDDAPYVVDLYIHWVYSGKIFSRKSRQEEEEDVKERKSADESGVLVRAYVFGEKIQDGDFQDAVIDALVHSIAMPDKSGNCWYPGASQIDQAYKGTPEGSPLRQLLVDIYMFYGDSKWLHGPENVEFLTGLAGRLLDKKKSPVIWDPIKPTSIGCHYHRHSEGDICYSVKHTRAGDAS
jgi:hypothetical protein